MALLMLVLSPASSAEVPAAANAPNAGASAGPAGAGVSAGGDYASEVPKDRVIDDKDGKALAADEDGDTIPVAQEFDFILHNDFRRQGAFDESLKTVVAVSYYGTRHVGGDQYPLEVHDARPNRTPTLIKTGGSSRFESSKSNQGIEIRGNPQGLAVAEERALLETFDFDTPVVGLERNRHVYKPLGMQKLPGMLTWKIRVDRHGGYHRVLYIDSHTGDIVKSTIMNAHGERVLAVVEHDYRSIDGIRVPFSVDYRGPDRTLLASDRFDRVEVKRKRS